MVTLLLFRMMHPTAAVHSLSDFLTDLIVLAFVRISTKPADADHDYGHGKYETLATTAGESPLAESPTGPTGIPIRTVHVKRRLNPGGPPSKAKHSLMTDSERVPRGKGEKNRC